ncbi:MAG: ABC transporter ATP-binding protein [Desulfobulbaceae bacterium]|nr:ABC transporter ATP-binding protein [Desulfobulbaceae bacterium]
MNNNDAPTQTATSPERDTAVFSAQGISKEYHTGDQRLEVLKGVNLTLETGKMAAIVGASGCGKTTLLHILGTLDRPSSGNLFFKNRDIFAENNTELALFRNRTVGFVFQFHHLLPEFSALENVMMPGLIGGNDRSEIIDDANDLLNKVGLASRAKHRVGELSGGEQQRVALARAMIMKPALLLADEPTGNLDAKTGNKVFDLLQEIHSSRAMSTIMVTHNPELAARMDRRLTLAEGFLHE